MFRKLLVLAAVAALSVAGAASANNGHGKIRYTFVGTLTATPNNGGISINVVGGNRQALRAMLGAPVTQTFAYGSTTEFLKWSKGAPTVVQAADLAAGDYVRVNVRAPRGASLSEIEATAAGIVGDHGTQLYKPSQPLYLFRGKLASVGSGTVTVDVTGGNHRALRLLIGSGSTQTFATGDETIFLLWQGKVPTVIDASKLVVGDRIVVRVRAAAHSTLAQVESSAAKHVGDREPATAK
ncbi:MAG TPA: hypothetical protein VFL60_08925 [Gaiellaceae bacterium]|nr:hypothetical protein [Gaiellaceae bacterium]